MPHLLVRIDALITDLQIVPAEETSLQTVYREARIQGISDIEMMLDGTTSAASVSDDATVLLTTYETRLIEASRVANSLGVVFWEGRLRGVRDVLTLLADVTPPLSLTPPVATIVREAPAASPERFDSLRGGEMPDPDERTCSECDDTFHLDDRGICESCDVCDDCCSCVSCSAYRCGRRGSRDDLGYCSDCDNCERHCECIRCAECGEECSDDYCGDCDGATCRSCCPGHGSIEFFNRPLKFHPPKNRLQRKRNPSARMIAAEIEVASITRDEGIASAVRKWSGSIVDDGSLPDTGFEINTAPAGGDLWLQQISEIGRALSDSDAEVDDSCGLHIHVDARDLRHADIARLMRLHAAFEDLFYAMVPTSRRTGTYSEPCGSQFVDYLDYAEKGNKGLRHAVARAIYGTSNTRSYRHSSKPGCRYVGLNVHSWYFRGTVEWRLWSGTVDTREIQACGMICARMVDLACSLTDREVDAIVAAIGAVDASDPKWSLRQQRIKNAWTLFSALIVGNTVWIGDFAYERFRAHLPDWDLIQYVAARRTGGAR